MMTVIPRSRAAAVAVAAAAMKTARVKMMSQLLMWQHTETIGRLDKVSRDLLELLLLEGLMVLVGPAAVVGLQVLLRHLLHPLV